MPGMQQALTHTRFLIKNHQGPLDPPLTRTGSEVQPQADSHPPTGTAGHIRASPRCTCCSGCDLGICSVLTVLTLSGVQSSRPLPLQVHNALSRSSSRPDVLQSSEFCIFQKDKSVPSALHASPPSSVWAALCSQTH